MAVRLSLVREGSRRAKAEATALGYHGAGLQILDHKADSLEFNDRGSYDDPLACMFLPRRLPSEVI
jgi:hypothetical protein